MERLRDRYRSAGETPPLPLDEALAVWTKDLGEAAKHLRPFVADTADLLYEAWRRDERILCEGAQGTFLDVDLGTYPFVTSSTTVAAGAATGLGLPPSALRKVVGVCKAYTTRVGEGPFPTELSGDEGEALRKRGGEFGATTGRPRRVGWCDLAMLRQAVRINGVTSLFLTKLDILSDMPNLRIATGYRRGDATLDRPPSDAVDLAGCEPIYEEHPGWTGSLRSVRRFGDLPIEARRYVLRIEDGAGCAIAAISVGSPRTAVVPVPPASRRE
jgi:adenylosuccinate synthase